MKKGCLSNIPPGKGTNQNEYLHRLLNRSMLTGATRLGPELAYAVLTLLFFDYNIKRLGLHHIPGSYFSRIFTFEKSGSSSTEKLEARRFPLSKTDAEEYDSYSRFSYDLINDDNVFGYAKRMAEVIGRIIQHDRFVWKTIKFSSNNSMSTTEKEQDTQEHFSQIRLGTNLSKFGKQKVPMLANGDCAFLSVAYGLRQIVLSTCSTSSTPFGLRLIDNVTLTPSAIAAMTLTELGHNLRIAFAKYILRPDVIEKFRAKTQFSRTRFIAEATRFEHPGVFEGEIGDLVMAAMADMLACPIVLITSIESCAVISLFPETLLIDRSIFVAFSQCGPGHYDAVDDTVSGAGNTNLGTESTSRQPMSDNTEPIVAKVSCRCGENDKSTEKIFCVDSARKTRCPCFKSNRQCSSDCHCRNCKNGRSYCTEPTVDSDATGTRKRKFIGYQHCNSESYLGSLGAAIAKGESTMLERCVLLCICQLISREGIDRPGKSNPNLVHALYCKVVKEHPHESLRWKSLKSVTALLTYLI